MSLLGVATTTSLAAAILAGLTSVAFARPLTVTKCAAVSTGGHKYNVSATGVTCSFADKWVVVLAKKPLGAHSRNVRLSGVPSEYTCQAGTKAAGVDMPDVAGTVQVAGNCAKGPAGLGGFGGGNPYFNWVVVSKY